MPEETTEIMTDQHLVKEVVKQPERKTLSVSPEAKAQMLELDRFVAEREMVAETFGWGLTVDDGSGGEKVVEFVSPDTEKIFVMDSLILDQHQSKLMGLLAGAKNLEMRIDNGDVVIVPDESEDIEEWVRFKGGQKGIQWGFAKANLEKLVGFELPDHASDLQSVIEARNQESGISSTSLGIQSDWELVLSGGSAIISGRFLDRVNKLAEEKKAKVNFTMHHHPNLGLAQWALEGKSLNDRQDYYRKLLHFSPADLRSMKNTGINFFEIRALGTPANLDSRTETTSRTYNVQEILDDSSRFRELIDQALTPAAQQETPKDLSELAQQLQNEITQLTNKDYPIKSLIEYYVGSDNYRELHQELRDDRNRRSNKDLMLYHLLEVDDDKPLPNFSQELFEARDETGIVDLVARVGQIYQQGGEERRRLEAAIDQHRIPDVFWITTSTDTARIREVAEKAKLLVA